MPAPENTTYIIQHKTTKEKDKVIKLLEKEMRGAVDMKVSMEVGTECGYDWYDAH
jgi:DNA polymerase-1